MAGQFPPLVGSEWVVGDAPKRLQQILLHGIQGKISVKGGDYNNAMPAWNATLNDKQIAQVLTYVRGQLGGNNAPMITEAQMDAARKLTAERTDPWNEAELKAIPAGPIDGGGAATSAAAAQAPVNANPSNSAEGAAKPTSTQTGQGPRHPGGFSGPLRPKRSSGGCLSRGVLTLTKPVLTPTLAMYFFAPWHVSWPGRKPVMTPTILRPIFRRLPLVVLLICGCLALGLTDAHAALRQHNLWWTAPAASKNAHEVDKLLMVIFWVTLFAFVSTQGVYIYFMIKYRERKGVKAVYSHGNNTLEIIWTTIPAVFFISLAVYSDKLWSRVAPQGAGGRGDAGHRGVPVGVPRP